MIAIYRITNKINGKQYIGQTSVGIAQRWANHCASAKTNTGCPLLARSISKHGRFSFSIEKIQDCEPEDADEAERHAIQENNTLAPNGYNLEAGGLRGRRTRTARPRRDHAGELLPLYLMQKRTGYVVCLPGHKSESFLSMALTMDEKLALARNYLDTGIHQDRRWPKRTKTGQDLPRGICCVTRKKAAYVLVGYRVRRVVFGKLHCRHFLTKDPSTLPMLLEKAVAWDTDRLKGNPIDISHAVDLRIPAQAYRV